MIKSKRNLLGGAVLAGLLGLGAQSAMASFALDIEAAGTGGDTKNLTVKTTDTQVTLNVYALIKGANADYTDEGINFAYFNAQASAGQGKTKLKGDMSPMTIVPDLNNPAGSSPGVAQDLNGDGDLDLGTVEGGNANDWIKPRSTSDMRYAKAGETDGNGAAKILIGTIKYTLKNPAAGQDTEIKLVGRLLKNRIPPLAFAEDGAAVNLTTAGITKVPVTDTPVNIEVEGGVTPTRVLVVDNTVAGSFGTLTINGSPNGYLSPVVNGNDVQAGDVKVQINGAGPAGPELLLLWAKGLPADLDAAKAELQQGGVTFLDMANPDFANLLAFYSRAENGGTLPTWLVQIGSIGDSIRFDLGTGVVLDQIAAVPEPAGLTLLGLGAAGLMMARRRRA